MLNNGTLKVRIDSLQAYLEGENLSVRGYLSLKYRDRGEEKVGQIEFSSKGRTATILQEVGVNAVGIAIGRIDTYPNQPNVRVILTIQDFTPIAATQPQVQAPVAPPTAQTPTPIPVPVPVPQPAVAACSSRLPF